MCNLYEAFAENVNNLVNNWGFVGRRHIYASLYIIHGMIIHKY